MCMCSLWLACSFSQWWVVGDGDGATLPQMGGCACWEMKGKGEERRESREKTCLAWHFSQATWHAPVTHQHYHHSFLLPYYCTFYPEMRASQLSVLSPGHTRFHSGRQLGFQLPPPALPYLPSLLFLPPVPPCNSLPTTRFYMKICMCAFTPLLVIG